MVSTGSAKPLVREIGLTTKSVSSAKRVVPGDGKSRLSCPRYPMCRHGPVAQPGQHAPPWMKIPPVAGREVLLLQAAAPLEGEHSHNGSGMSGVQRHCIA